MGGSRLKGSGGDGNTSKLIICLYFIAHSAALGVSMDSHVGEKRECFFE